MAQEEHRPQEEGFQVVIQVAAVHLQVQRPRSTQEEQEILVAIHRLYLHRHLHPADRLIHGHPWIDQGNHSRT